MRWLYNSVLDDVDIDSYSTQNSNYPASNLVNQILTTTWRTTTVASAATVVWDAGSGNTLTADTIVISGHNFTSGATIKIQGNSSDAWGAPDVDETITYNSGHCFKYFTSAAKRFWRVYVLDTTNTDDYIEIGRVFLGSYLQVDPSSEINFTITNSRNDLVTETDQGNVYGTPGVERRIFAYTFPATLWTMVQNVRTVWSTVGKYKNWYHFNFNSDRTYIDVAYVRITNDFQENWIGNARITYQLNLRETG